MYNNLNIVSKIIFWFTLNLVTYFPIHVNLFLSLQKYKSASSIWIPVLLFKSIHVLSMSILFYTFGNLKFCFYFPIPIFLSMKILSYPFYNINRSYYFELITVLPSKSIYVLDSSIPFCTHGNLNFCFYFPIPIFLYTEILPYPFCNINHLYFSESMSFYLSLFTFYPHVFFSIPLQI